jgi:DNA primase
VNAPARIATAPDEIVERVRAASEISAIVQSHVALKKAGRTWKGLCPFHQEKTPSFTVSPERQTYHCFGCGAGGDVFRFVQETEKISFGEALRLLADRAGITLPARRRPAEGEPLYEILEEAAEFYRRSLLDATTGRAARAVLEARGIEEGTRERFGMGYAPAGWDALSSRLVPRYSAALLVRAGLAVDREGGRGSYDRFRDRIVVPLRLPNGRVVGFGGRAAANEEPKYLNSPETPIYHKGSFVFGLGEAKEALRASGEAVLVEGYFDVMALSQAGVTDAVAASGTAITPEQSSLLLRFTPRVCLALDGDRAGLAAASRALAPLLAAGLAVRVMVLPEGDDPDTFVRREGEAAFAARREKAPGVAEFLCRGAGAGGEEHGRAVAAVVELARTLPDLARRESLLVSADRLLGVGVDRLRRATEAQTSAARSVSVRKEALPAPTPLRPATRMRPVEHDLLALLVAVPRLAEPAERGVSAEWIRHPAAREAWDALVADPTAGVAQWSRQVGEAGRELLTALASESVETTEPERALGDILRRLEWDALRIERATRQKELVSFMADSAQARELQGEIERLSVRMSSLMDRTTGGPGARKGADE